MKPPVTEYTMSVGNSINSFINMFPEDETQRLLAKHKGEIDLKYLEIKENSFLYSFNKRDYLSFQISNSGAIRFIDSLSGTFGLCN